jgi:hypothetical protein
MPRRDKPVKAAGFMAGETPPSSDSDESEIDELLTTVEKLLTERRVRILEETCELRIITGRP